MLFGITRTWGGLPQQLDCEFAYSAPVFFQKRADGFDVSGEFVAEDDAFLEHFERGGGGLEAEGGANSVGELRWMRGAEDDGRAVGVNVGKAAGGVRVHDVAEAGVHVVNDLADFLIVGASGAEHLGVEILRGPFALGLQRLHNAAHGSRIAFFQIIQEALEIGRSLNVHRRREAGVDGAAFVMAGGEEAVEDVVLVRGDAEATDGQAHLLHEPTGKDVAKIAGGHDELDLAGVAHFLRQAAPGVDVIHALREDAREVDGVDRREPHLFVELLVVVQLLHDALGVVKITRNRNRENIVRPGAGHLAFLQGRD